jgi:hypothetical protein
MLFHPKCRLTRFSSYSTRKLLVTELGFVVCDSLDPINPSIQFAIQGCHSASSVMRGVFRTGESIGAFGNEDQL